VFGLGGVSSNISVSILGGLIKEPDETLLLNIAPAIGAVRFKNTQAVGTIVNDDK
jgi:hypothetical protein